MATFRKRNNRWQVQVRSRQHGSISKSFLKKADAQVWAAEQERLMQIGEWHKDHQPNATISDLLRKYQQEVTPTKRAYQREITRINRLLSDPVATIPLNQFSSTDAVRFRDRRSVDGSRAAEYDLVILRHAWNLAVKEWEWKIGTNPLSLIRFPKPSAPRQRRLHHHEYEMIRQESKVRAWYLWPVICLAIETGMRKSELLNLQWRDIYFERRQLSVSRGKNGQGRVIPLTQCALNILYTTPRTHEAVFPVSENALRLSWDRLLMAVDIKDLRFHDLRHEALSRLFEKGLSVPEVAMISGHKTVSQLFRYVHVKIPEDV
jgi:integrase